MEFLENFIGDEVIIEERDHIDANILNRLLEIRCLLELFGWEI